MQVHFFSNNDVLSKYWLSVSLYYCLCFASPAVSAAAHWNGSVGWSARKIQPLLPQLLPSYFTIGLVLQFDHGVVQWAAVLASLWREQGGWEAVCGKGCACFIGVAASCGMTIETFFKLFWSSLVKSSLLEVVKRKTLPTSLLML